MIFRRFFSGSNRERRWINPGYLKGPWLPVYGFGLCVLYLLSGLSDSLPTGVLGRILLILIMTVSVTAVELIAGIVSLDLLRVRLWDYSGEWGNLRGVVCPRFALFWGIICSVYLLFVHRYLVFVLEILSLHALLSVFVGIYIGILIVDAMGINFGLGREENRDFSAH